MSIQSYIDRYETREREIIILRHEGAGAGKVGEFWDASAYFLAYYDVETQTYFNEEGRISWILSKEEEESRSYFSRFRDETLYRVRVRFLKDRTVPEGRLPSLKNEFYLVEILDEGVKCQPLEDRLVEYRTPTILKDDVLGELKLDKRFSNFSGQVFWNNKQISIKIEVDQTCQETWADALKVTVALYKELDKWDEDMRTFATSELIELANDWVDEDGVIITNDEFKKRISLYELVVSPNGDITAYYNDDDIFADHSVIIDGNLEKGLESATI